LVTTTKNGQHYYNIPLFGILCGSLMIATDDPTGEVFGRISSGMCFGDLFPEQTLPIAVAADLHGTAHVHLFLDRVTCTMIEYGAMPESTPLIGKNYTNLMLAASVMATLMVIMRGVVCVTESGPGCPDWPGCYGRPVPPPRQGAIIEYSRRVSAGLGIKHLLSRNQPSPER
jgi:hypothetical protein